MNKNGESRVIAFQTGAKAGLEFGLLYPLEHPEGLAGNMSYWEVFNYWVDDGMPDLFNWLKGWDGEKRPERQEAE